MILGMKIITRRAVTSTNPGSVNALWLYATKEIRIANFMKMYSRLD